MPLFIDDSSKEFIMKLANRDYSLGNLKYELTKLKIKIKQYLHPVPTKNIMINKPV